MAVNRKKQARFSISDDIRLLREVAATNPFKNKGKWAVIGETLSTACFQIDGRRARERTNLLISLFKKDNRESLKKSGIDEDYTERDHLLEEIVELMEEEDRKREIDKGKTDKAGNDVRKRALETLTPTKDSDAEDDVPKAKKSKSSNNILAYLQEKKESEVEVRKEEIEMKKQELQLQKDRFELEREERRQRFELERQEKLMMLELFKKLVDKN